MRLPRFREIPSFLFLAVNKNMFISIAGMSYCIEAPMLIG